MSHHLDSPGARRDVRLDITDLYVFRGETGTVFVMDVCPSIAGEDAPRGFHSEATYEFKIDGNGDNVEDLTYRLTFGERDAEGNQNVELRRLAGADARDADASGAVIARGATGRQISSDGGLRLWAGEASDPFWIEPGILAAIGRAFADGARADLSSWDPTGARNLFAENKVYAIVLEVPDGHLLPVAGDDRRVNVWALTSLATDAGGRRAVNRAGHPMVHPLFTQHDGDLGDRLNVTRPADDPQNFGKVVADMVAGVVGAYGTAEDPHAYGRSVAERLFPNVLPYTVGTPAVYGFDQWNGRSLTDNAPDVMFSLATNTAFTIGLTRDSVPAKPTRTFPYVPPVPDHACAAGPRGPPPGTTGGGRGALAPRLWTGNRSWSLTGTPGPPWSPPGPLGRGTVRVAHRDGARWAQLPGPAGGGVQLGRGRLVEEHDEALVLALVEDLGCGERAHARSDAPLDVRGDLHFVSYHLTGSSRTP